METHSGLKMLLKFLIIMKIYTWVKILPRSADVQVLSINPINKLEIVFLPLRIGLLAFVWRFWMLVSVSDVVVVLTLLHACNVCPLSGKVDPASYFEFEIFEARQNLYLKSLIIKKCWNYLNLFEKIRQKMLTKIVKFGKSIKWLKCKSWLICNTAT